MSDIIYTVSQFNRMIKGILENDPRVHEFFLEGELTGVTYYKSGHLYFSLKDSEGQVRCAAFNYRYKRIVEDLKNGEKVKIFGDVGFYEARGDFQILVRYIERLDEKGDLFLKLEEVKKKLEKEGLFLKERKRKLPFCPKSIGVVTALTGAAFHDIVKTTRKRYKNVNIYLYPAKVQGKGSAEEIIKGIECLNRVEELDFIIVGRGGGSLEDLWSFNEESVARAIYRSEKPIVSAVGHEIDYMLTDFVADVRAATPTQAAELAIPEKKVLIEKINSKKIELERLVLKKIELEKNRVNHLKNIYILKNFSQIIEEKNIILIDKERELKKIILNILKLKGKELEKRIEKIDGINPIKLLQRGYGIVKKDKKIIKKVEEIEVNDIIEVVVSDGIVKSRVKEIIKK